MICKLYNLKSAYVNTIFKWSNIRVKEFNEFKSFEDLLDITLDTDKFFALVKDKYGLYNFISKLSALYSAQFGLPAPKVVFYDEILNLDKYTLGFTEGNSICLNNRFYERCRLVAQSKNEYEKFKLVFEAIDTTIHETTHVMQNVLKEALISGKSLPNLAGNKEISSQIIFTAYVGALVHCLKDVYKKGIYSSRFACFSEIFGILSGRETPSDKIALQRNKYYGNNPLEMSARLSSLNVIKKLSEKQPHFKSYIPDLEDTDRYFTEYGKTDIYNAIILPCQEYMVKCSSVDKSVFRLKEIFIGFKEFCKESLQFQNVLKLIEAAENENKYSDFAADVMKGAKECGDISQEELDAFEENRSDYKNRKKNAIKDINNCFVASANDEVTG